MLNPRESLNLTRQQSVYSKTLLGKDDSSDDATRQLLAHVPNSLIYFDYKKDMPATKEFLGVVLFADISGFTKLTECYSTLETSDGTSGTDKLQHTLNAYIGKIVEEIIQRNGDVLKFAGDAILATWKCSDIGHNAKALLNKVINCSIDIQKKCHNFVTEVGIVLCVKLAVAVGPMCLTYVGLPSDKQFDLSGTAVDDVGLTEKRATPGAIILSQLAWANCDQNLFDVTSMEEGQFFKIIGHSQDGGNSLAVDGGGTGNKAGTILQQVEKSVRSPLDDLVDQVVDYTQDMPKALMMADDDVKEANDYFLTQTVIGVSKQDDKKKMKFDRQTMTSDLKSSEIENLRAYVAKPVLDKLDNGQNLDWLSEMREVSVLFINMKLPDPAYAASEALQKAFEVVHESCTKFGGNLNKLFGFDKGCTFVVIFGLPGQKHEDDPVRALKCALAIFDSLHSIQEIVNESIGVTTGLAFTGVVGHTDRHEYTVIGSKVNMAARLMMFYPGLLTCDVDTYEASASRLRKQDFIVQPYIELKGMKDPGIVREYNPNSSKKEEEDDFDFPILGRKNELSRIHDLFDTHDHDRHIVAKAKNNTMRNSQIVVIEGDAGIGKTRLVEQVMDDAERRLYRVIHVEGDLAQVEMSGHISNTIIKMFFEQGVGGVGGVVEREAMVALFKKSGDAELMENLHLIKDILQISGSSHHIMRESSDTDLFNKRRTLILKVLKILTSQQTCLLAIDNARYVDEKSWSFLRDLFNETSSILVIAVRSNASNLPAPALELLQQKVTVKLPLPGLEKVDIVNLICQLLQVSETPKKLCELIHRKSQGFPSWCEQLIKDALYATTIQIITKPTGPGAILVNSSTDVYGTPITTPIQSRRNSLNPDHTAVGGGVKPPKSDLLKNLIGAPKMDYCFLYRAHEYVSATEGVVPEECDEICIITPGADLNTVLQPDSVKDMVLARMDRMTLNEQTVLKCASVLGQSFTRDLLKAIIPKNCANMLDTTLYNLCKQQFFECGSLQLQSSQHRNHSSHHLLLENKVTQPHHHHHHLGIQNVQVLCACYWHEGFPVINLSQVNTYADGKKRVCLYFHFSNTFVQEAAYALWLEDQRKSLMEKAALYLERYSDKCRACGGNGFIPGHGKGLSAPELMKCGTGRKFSMVATTTPEQTKTGRSFSQFGRKSIGCSAFMPDGCGTGAPQQGKNLSPSTIQEEASRVFKNCKSEHIKNYTVRGTRGESIGLLLVEMARVLASTKLAENGGRPVHRTRFGKSSDRDHPSSNKTLSKLATRALMTEFRMQSSMGQAQLEMSRKNHNFLEGCEIDLSQCQCAELHANILPQLVYYWRMAGNHMKCFQYMIDAAASFIDVNDSMKTSSFLRDIDHMVERERDINNTNNNNNNNNNRSSLVNFIITEEERAKIECLKGQALCNMGCYKEGITHFHNALHWLKSPQPTNRFGLITRTWKAYLVQLLHLKMPGVFQEHKRDHMDFSMDLIHCLSYLSKAYTIQKEYDKAYLANLEQLNLAEEASTNYWNELLNAYSDMILSCHIFKKFETGKCYEGLALDMTKSASLNVEDTVSMGKLHFTLVSFHLANQDVNSAFESAVRCHKLARSINDLNLKLTILPFLVQINLFKGRLQACSEVMSEYKQLLQGLDDEDMTIMYYNCCMDQLLDTGDTLEELSDITRFLSTRRASGNNLYVAKLALSVALWYARQESRILVPQFHTFNEIPDNEPEDEEIQHEIFKIRFNLYQLECSLHEYRCHLINPTTTGNEIKVKTAVNQNRVQDAVKGYGLFQARFIHYQAYYAFLRKKGNRAKLLLEDCRVASKNVDGGYDLEWCQASLRSWFSLDDDVERFVTSGGAKYVLPTFKQM